MSESQVSIVRNDGSEEFTLKSNRVETEVSNGLVTDSIISGVSRAVVGGKLVLDLRTFDISFDIQGMDPSDYPNAGTYADDDKGFRDELERASLEWGYTRSSGFDTLRYDGRILNGVITNATFTEDTTSKPARQYDGTIEWTYLDSYVS